MPYLDLTPGFQLYYEIDDHTDPWTPPETIVMVHGFTENTDAWRAWVPHLARHYRVIRFDQRGFGRSTPVARDFTFTTELLVDNTARVIEHLAGGSAHVIGAKSGGLITIELAAMRPDLVKTITLASTPLAPPQPQNWLAHMEKHGMRSWARLTMPPRLGSKMPPRGIDWWVDMMGSTSIDTAHVYLRWVSTIDVAADLHRVNCPALVLTTTSPRRAYSKTDAETYREGLPHAEVAALAVDGYHVAATAPDECAPIVLDFLRRHAECTARSRA
jgi:3-oxoadipate enol-lactonase